MLCSFHIFSFGQNDKTLPIWTKQQKNDVVAIKDKASFNQHHFLIYQFNQLPGKSEQEKLALNGIELLGYLGNKQYWVRTANAAISKRNFDKFGIESVSLNLPILKHNPYIEAIKEDQNVAEYVVLLWSEKDVNAYIQYIQSVSAVIVKNIKSDRKLVILQTKGSELQHLVQHPAVAYAGPLARNPIALTDDGANMHRVNVLNAEAPFGPGLYGNGVNVGLWDGGVTGNHVDLNGAVENIENVFFSLSETRHATNVSGIIGGRGHLANRFPGMAPEATIKTWSFDGDLIDEMRAGIVDENLQVINSSFMLNDYNDPKVEMCYTPGLYVLESAELDKMVRDFPNTTHTIANGNDQATCGSIFPFQGIPIGLQSAKNVINVGWIDENQLHVGGSNIGPTLDGRWKPEVMAKGKTVFSTQLNNLYDNIQGSSFAAPAVAGSAALLYEGYKNIYGNFPDAALVRAVICNTATDLTTANTPFFFGPDMIHGFGRINAESAYETISNQQFTLDNISNGDQKTFEIVVPAGLDKLNVAIAWSDMEGIPGDLTPLVNNLDITVTGPDNTEYLPWVLKPFLWFLPSFPGVDSVNNIEQVTVQSPAAGTYTVTVKGTEIPFGPQDFAMTYDFLEQGVKFTHPIGGEKMFPGEQRYIRWDKNGTGSANSLIEISYNNGATWATIGTATQNRDYFVWSTATAHSHECRMRVTSGAYQHISEPFTIMRRVTSIIGDACDQHLLINWAGIPDADSYEILKLDVALDKFIPIDTIVDTFYLFSNLTNGEEIWLAVTARDGNNSAMRSNGFVFTPSAVNCDFISDIGVSSLHKPKGFRFPFNGTIPSYNESLQVVVKNYSNSDISGFDVCYQLGASPPVCEPFGSSLLANSIDTFTFSAIETFDDTIVYVFKVWTAYIADSNANNDTIQATVKVIPSYPASLPYFNDFESVPTENYVAHYFGIEGMREWDFDASSAFGRLSIGRFEQFGYESEKALTLDILSGTTNQINETVLHLNLNGYEDSTIYLDFAYLGHADLPDAGDVVLARANENEDWVEVYNFADSVRSGRYIQVNALNLTDLLITQNSQIFGETFELKFSQEGDGQANFVSFNDGRSIDNVKVYSVGEDIRITDLNLKGLYCASDDRSFPVEITIENLSPVNASNVMVGFTSDFGDNVTEYIPLILAGQSITYEFAMEANYSPDEEIWVTAFVAHTNDNFADNDTLKKLVLVRPFAAAEYYDDFETVNGNILDIGTNSSWELGEPDNTIIQTAASGNNAWVTGLSYYYSHGENSYLYSPCFDFSAANENPNIAFNLQLAIQSNFDLFSFQYSEDGINWNSITENAQSFGWYNDSGNGNFWDIDIAEWTTASSTLDLNALANTGAIVFRAVMLSDGAVRKEGVGFDDLHITDDLGANLPMVANEVFTETISVSSDWNHVDLPAGIWLSLKGDANPAVEVGVIKESNSLQYTDNFLLPRHFWINGEGDFTCRLYLPYAEYQTFLTGIPEWQAPKNMSVLAYSGIQTDASINNNDASFSIIDNEDLSIKPYRNGYILEFNISGNAEMYVRSDFPIEQDVILTDFTATGISASAADLVWNTSKENGVEGFVIEVSENGIDYDSILFVIALGTDSTGENYAALDDFTEKECLLYYRLIAVDASGDYTYLTVDSAAFIFPEMVDIDSFEANIVGPDVVLTWGTHAEKCNDRFEISYSTDNINFSFLAAVNSFGDSEVWTPYSFLDNITPKTGTNYYQLIQYFIDGSFQNGGIDSVQFLTDFNIVWDTVTATAITAYTASVTWNTSEEINVDGFVVEKSFDGINYDSVGYVISTAIEPLGAAYEYLDAKIWHDCIEYYRITAVGSGGERVELGTDSARFVYQDFIVAENFTASILGNDVNLTWTSTKEQCGVLYFINYSKNNLDYSYLGQVNLNNTPSNYSFLDDITVKDGNHYYKLYATSIFEDTFYIWMDSISFTSVLVENDLLDFMQVNYYHGALNINSTKPFDGMIRVMDSKGAEVYRQKVMLPIGQNQIPLQDSEQWARGIYLVQLMNNEGQLTIKIPLIYQE
jgi:hypothetical protein